MTAPLQNTEFDNLVNDLGGKTRSGKLKTMADSWKPYIGYLKTLHITGSAMLTITLIVAVMLMASMLLPLIYNTKMFGYIGGTIGATATFMGMLAIGYTVWRISQNRVNIALIAISMVHILSWSVIASILVISSNSTLIDVGNRTVLNITQMKYYGGGSIGDSIAIVLINGSLRLFEAIHPAIILPTAFMLISSIFLGNPFSYIGKLLNMIFPSETGKNENISTTRIKKTEKVDNGIAELFNLYGLEGATSKKVIAGPVIQREIVQLPRGANVDKLYRNMKNIKRDFGKPLIINAFVKGYKGCIAVDVPNSNRQNVEYQELYNSPEFQHCKATVPLMLGKDTQGNIIIKDMADMPHLLIAGASGAGKTSSIHSIICSLSMSLSPDYIKFQIIDLKRTDMTFYDKLPHLAAPTAYTFDEAYETATGVYAEIERRKQVIANAGCLDIKHYNQSSGKRLPYIIFIIDECASIFDHIKTTDPENTKKEKEHRQIMLPTMNLISQQARAFGIYMLPATQKPSKTAMPSDFQANISERICLTTTSEEDSANIINSPNAAYLLKKGDGMYYNAEISEYERIHMPFLDAKNGDLGRTINQIQDKWSDR